MFLWNYGAAILSFFDPALTDNTDNIQHHYLQ